MPYPYYDGQGKEATTPDLAELSRSHQDHLQDPAGYLADKRLVDAVNVALLLGQPLLLTGEPGTGKTRLADSLAWELGLGQVLKFETKSTSKAADLFYTFDTVGRFHAVQIDPDKARHHHARDYISYNALGRAILYANPRRRVKDYLPPGFIHPKPETGRLSVVLIDEIDKAPRDFPNDILNELENMYFRVPELRFEYPELLAITLPKEDLTNDASPPEMPTNDRAGSHPTYYNRPLVILTSNAEKQLPDAFLRRCIYYHIPFPDTKRLAQIVYKRLMIGDGIFRKQVLLFFEALRKTETRLQKKPATAELLNWLTALQKMGIDYDKSLVIHDEAVKKTLYTLVKYKDDLHKADSLWKDPSWQKENT